METTGGSTQSASRRTGKLAPLARRVAQRTAALLQRRVVVSVGESVLASSGAAGGEDESALPVCVSYEGEPLTITLHGVDQEAAPWAENIVELVIEQARMIEHFPHLDQLRDRFIRDLLIGDLHDETDVRRLGQILGVDLERPRSVILIDASEQAGPGSENGSRPCPASPETQLARSRDIIASVVRFFRLPNETICGYIGDGQIAVLKASTSQDLEQWADDTAEGEPSSWANLGALKRAVTELSAHLQREIGVPLDISVGRYHPGLAGLRASYEDCRLALELGRTRQPRRVHCLDELGLAAFVAVSHDLTKRSLAGRVLGPLRHDPELIPTLRAFFEEECGTNGTAQRLVIHRNTLRYRLDKVLALTGLNPRSFNDAVLLRVALELDGPSSECAEVPF